MTQWILQIVFFHCLIVSYHYPNIPQTCQGELKFLRSSYPKNVILSYININSIRNKLNSLEILLNKTVDANYVHVRKCARNVQVKLVNVHEINVHVYVYHTTGTATRRVLSHTRPHTREFYSVCYISHA